MAGAKRSQFFVWESQAARPAEALESAAPPPYDINSTNNEERMILATLPTGTGFGNYMFFLLFPGLSHLLSL